MVSTVRLLLYVNFHSPKIKCWGGMSFPHGDLLLYGGLEGGGLRREWKRPMYLVEKSRLKVRDGYHAVLQRVYSCDLSELERREGGHDAMNWSFDRIASRLPETIMPREDPRASFIELRAKRFEALFKNWLNGVVDPATSGASQADDLTEDLKEQLAAIQAPDWLCW